MTPRRVKPGVYEMTAADYHADPCPEPSLSASIATEICLRSPLHAQHEHPRLNPEGARQNGEHLDIGIAAHQVLLEGTNAVSIVDARDWRTNQAKEAREVARTAGKVPLLAHVWTDVQAMVLAARRQLAIYTDGSQHMFQTGGGPERTLIWHDNDVWCRARLDWLRPPPKDARLPDWAIDDYKTTSVSANPDVWTRTLFQYGYDIQAAWYQRAVHTLLGHQTVFRFAVQETFKPYALSVVTLGPDALTIAQKKVIYALDVWRACLKDAAWPGYPRRTCYASLPAWHEAWWIEREQR